MPLKLHKFEVVDFVRWWRSIPFIFEIKWKFNAWEFIPDHKYIYNFN